MSDVPEGYKMSEVGVIPSDWDVKTLENITTEIGDGIHSTPQYVSSSDFFFVNGNNLVDNSIKITDNTMCVTEYEYNKHKKKLNGQTILLSINGTIGNIAFFDDEKVILGKSAAYINVNNFTNKRYVFYLLQSSIIENYFEDELTGSTIRNLSLKAIRNTPITLPPPPEQQAIASALGDIDTLITALGQLIAKKRNIKQGAMQQLLTGKKRLTGFGREWEVKKLGDLGSFSKGKGIRKDEVVSEGLPCIRYGEIYTIHNDYIKSFKSFITQSLANESIELKKGDLLFAGSGETAEEIGKCVAFVGNERVFAGGDIVILRPSINNNSLFLGFLLNNPIVSNQKARMGQGDAVVHISGKNLSEIQIPLPPTKEEQNAIAQILSDMDAEIEAFEKKQAKYKTIKQGMMQELLTGKTRLI